METFVLEAVELAEHLDRCLLTGLYGVDARAKPDNQSDRQNTDDDVCEAATATDAETL